MNRYLVVIEDTETGFSAYSPDLPGCISTGKTMEEVKKNIREAIQLHLDGLREEGYSIPQSHSHATYCEVAS